MLDEWEHVNGLNPTNALDATEDKDSDGSNNLHEQEAGTDPDDDGSVFAVTELSAAPSTSITVATTNSRIYTLQ